jgi:hypothetical protein
MTLERIDGLCAVGLEPGLWRWTPAAVNYRAEMKSYVEAALKSQAEGTAPPFTTMLRATGTIVGSTRYGAIDPANRLQPFQTTVACRPSLPEILFILRYGAKAPFFLQGT